MHESNKVNIWSPCVRVSRDGISLNHRSNLWLTLLIWMYHRATAQAVLNQGDAAGAPPPSIPHTLWRKSRTVSRLPPAEQVAFLELFMHPSLLPVCLQSGRTPASPAFIEIPAVKKLKSKVIFIPFLTLEDAIPVEPSLAVTPRRGLFIMARPKASRRQVRGPV